MLRALARAENLTTPLIMGVKYTFVVMNLERILRLKFVSVSL